MPYLHIKVGKPLCEQSIDALRKECESIISLIPGKNADNCMIQIETDCTMYMKGEKKACAFVDLRLYKASPAEKKQAFVTALTNYSAGNAAWSEVVTAFVDGWAYEYNVVNG